MSDREITVTFGAFTQAIKDAAARKVQIQNINEKLNKSNTELSNTKYELTNEKNAHVRTQRELDNFRKQDDAHWTERTKLANANTELNAKMRKLETKLTSLKTEAKEPPPIQAEVVKPVANKSSKAKKGSQLSLSGCDDKNN